MTVFIRKLQSHYLRQGLRRNKMRLLAYVDCLSKGWIPAIDDSEISDYLAVLREYIELQGREVPSDDLLCYGLTRPGTQRGVVPPVAVLTENRGGFREKRQRESFDAIKGIEEAIDFAKLLGKEIEVSVSESVKELAEESTKCPTITDNDKFRLYGGIRQAEIEEVSDFALNLLKKDEKQATELAADILRDLTSFQLSPLPERILLELIKLRFFWPASAYRDGEERIASAILREIDDATDHSEINAMLLAFAWTRCEFAHSKFSEWRDSPPAWADALNIEPLGFTPFAGWSLDASGDYRELVSLQARRLTVVSETREANPVQCLVPLTESCPSCGGTLSNLFDRVFPVPAPTQAASISFPTCLHCAAYEVVFTRHLGDGATERLAPLEMPDFPNDGYIMESNAREVSDELTSPYAGQEAFTLNDASSIGGFPSWLQDAEYPACFECGELMNFIAQHDNGGVGEEGIYYGFYCWECNISAVHYQQT